MPELIRVELPHAVRGTEQASYNDFGNKRRKKEVTNLQWLSETNVDSLLEADSSTILCDNLSDSQRGKNEPEGRYLFECSRSQYEQLGLFTISSCRQRWHYEIAEAKESRRKLNITKTKLPSHQRGKSFESSSCANSENDYKSELCFAVIRNDGTPKNMERLITLKNIFAKQLPKMPKEYIVRLVMDRRHFSMALLKVSLSA